MLVAGQRVRHRKQAAWGIGVIASAAKAGALVELVIDFVDTTRTLKLKPELVETMIEVLSTEDNAAIDAAEVARKKRLKAKKLAPTTRLERGFCKALTATGDGHVMFATSPYDDAKLIICTADGTVVEEIALASVGGRPFVPDVMITDGRGLFVGTQRFNSDLMFARRGEPTSTLWSAGQDLGIITVSMQPGIGAIVHDLEHVILARPDGGHEVPLSLAGRSVSTAVLWHDGVLVGANGEGDDHYFRYLYLGLDGELRHQGAGGEAVPFDDELMLTFDREGVTSRTRDGAVAGRLAARVEFDSFTRVDDEVVFSLRDLAGLVRWHPRVDQPRWISELDRNAEGLRPPVRIGRWIAATVSVGSTRASPVIWVVDAETGSLVHALDLESPVDTLVPVGDDALFALPRNRRTIAWRGLSTDRPERLLLVHTAQCERAVSPAPGVLVTVDDDAVSFFTL